MQAIDVNFSQDGVGLVRLENDSLRVDVAPGVGGRIVSLFCKRAQREVLWRNIAQPLVREHLGSAFDPVFFGGIDELLPNDTPEFFDGEALLDHGELWTMALNATVKDNAVCLHGRLPLSGLAYERTLSLQGADCALQMSYRIRNERTRPSRFMFKLHAALPAFPGDRILCPARWAQVADPAWSRWKTQDRFDWPWVEGSRADVVPRATLTSRSEVDFLYLGDLQEGEMGWRSDELNLAFKYEFDAKVFPYCCLFASYGGFHGHRTVVLEPSTAKPTSLRDAANNGTCTVLHAGETLATEVVIRAGRIADVFA